MNETKDTSCACNSRNTAACACGCQKADDNAGDTRCSRGDACACANCAGESE